MSIEERISPVQNPVAETWQPVPELATGDQYTDLTDSAVVLQARGAGLIGQTIDTGEGLVTIDGDASNVRFTFQHPRIGSRKEILTITRESDTDDLVVRSDAYQPSLESEQYTASIEHKAEIIPLNPDRKPTYATQFGHIQKDGSFKPLADATQIANAALRTDKAGRLKRDLAGWSDIVSGTTTETGEHGRVASRAPKARTVGFLGRVMRRGHARS